MKRAFVVIREQPWYRRQSFADGLKAAGYEVLLKQPDHVDAHDVLCQWNRYGSSHELALRFEKCGGTVIVCENGFLGERGSSPKYDVHPGGPQPHHYYSLAIGWHNGRGQWVTGGTERWERLGVPLMPWRTTGKHILVCANRSFGVEPQVMPSDWAERTAARLKKQTARQVVIRLHPGNDAPKRPLAEDLKGCWACIIWSSGAAVHALAQGIPTFIEAPFHILKAASATGSIDDPVMPERLPHFQRMAWAQWRISEVASGEPFKYLLT